MHWRRIWRETAIPGRRTVEAELNSVRRCAVQWLSRGSRGRDRSPASPELERETSRPRVSIPLVSHYGLSNVPADAPASATQSPDVHLGRGSRNAPYRADRPRLSRTKFTSPSRSRCGTAPGCATSARVSPLRRSSALQRAARSRRSAAHASRTKASVAVRLSIVQGTAGIAVTAVAGTHRLRYRRSACSTRALRLPAPHSSASRSKTFASEAITPASGTRACGSLCRRRRAPAACFRWKSPPDDPAAARQCASSSTA